MNGEQIRTYVVIERYHTVAFGSHLHTVIGDHVPCKQHEQIQPWYAFAVFAHAPDQLDVAMLGTVTVMHAHFARESLIRNRAFANVLHELNAVFHHNGLDQRVMEPSDELGLRETRALVQVGAHVVDVERIVYLAFHKPMRHDGVEHVHVPGNVFGLLRHLPAASLVLARTHDVERIHVTARAGCNESHDAVNPAARACDLCVAIRGAVLASLGCGPPQRRPRFHVDLGDWVDLGITEHRPLETARLIELVVYHDALGGAIGRKEEQRTAHGMVEHV